MSNKNESPEAIRQRLINLKRMDLSPCCEAPFDDSKIVKEGQYKNHGWRYCAKCGEAYFKWDVLMDINREDLLYGYIDIENTERFENGEIVLGCITTKYGRQGEIISRTQTDTVRLFFPGKKMTKQEAREIGVKI